MNFDPNTLAKEEQADKESEVSLLVKAAAVLGLLEERARDNNDYDLSDYNKICSLHSDVWDRAVKLVEPVDFYRRVKNTERTM